MEIEPSMDRKKIAILGATGSIGTQALDVIARLGYGVTALAGYQNDRVLAEQARRFRPDMVCAVDEKAAERLRDALHDTDIRVLAGEEGLISCAVAEGTEILLQAVVGMAGLRPTLAAIAEKIPIALANKETLVCAGDIVLSRAREAGVPVLPVDSEHSAIFQCLEGVPEREAVKKILLTASGGPFFGKTRAELAHVTPEMALRHPTWNMGAKVTIDSSTLANKGLELIEAMHLFSMSEERIEIVVHRESIVHSMVELSDNAVIAQLGSHDMRLPIQYALTYPARVPCPAPALDFVALGKLSFYAPDMETFSCLAQARRAAKLGGNAGAVFNAANEAAVALFLAGKIPYLSIGELIKAALDGIQYIEKPDLGQILETDIQTRAFVSDLVKE